MLTLPMSSLRKRLLDTFTPDILERLLKDFKEAIMEMVTEAENREDKKLLAYEDYKKFRLTQGTCYAMFDLIECCYDFVLPEEVLEDSVFKNLREEAMLILCWTNVS